MGKRKNKKPALLESPNGKRPNKGNTTTKVARQPDLENKMQLHPTWAFEICDSSRWCIKEHFCFEIFETMKSYETMTWQEILTTTGGKNSKGYKNHNVPVNKIIKAARDRLTESHIFTEELVSLTVGSTGRIYGLLTNGTLKIIWYDPNHEIYEVKKRHT